jgi:chorismate mutase/prephenate dehydratase
MTSGASRADQQLQHLEERARGLEDELVRVLEERADVARQQRVLLEGEPPREVDEAAWMRRLEARAVGQLPAESLRAILREVRAALRGIELPGRIAFVGPAGGLCHQMVRRHFGAGSPTLECPGVVEALEAVARGRAVTAAIPLESSAEGLAQSSVTALARSELVIVGERSLSYAFDLVGGEAERPLERVYATPAARAACRGFLAEKLPAVELVEVGSPLECLERTESDRRGAAIVLHDCARESALAVLESNVGDAADAFVRFALVAARPAKRSEWNRTCLLFGVQDEPGSLFEVLRHFAERGLNLGRVQSRPLPQAGLLRGKGWDYAFYLEVDGHESDRSMVAALDRVRRATKYLRVLGSYPVDEPPG